MANRKGKPGSSNFSMEPNSEPSNMDRDNYWNDGESNGSDSVPTRTYYASDKVVDSENAANVYGEGTEEGEGNVRRRLPLREGRETPQHWDSADEYCEQIEQSEAVEDEYQDEEETIIADDYQGDGENFTDDEYQENNSGDDAYQEDDEGEESDFGDTDDPIPDEKLHANLEGQIKAIVSYLQKNRRVRVELFDQYLKLFEKKVRIFQQILVCLTGFCQSIWWSSGDGSPPKQTGPCFFEDSEDASDILEPMCDCEEFMAELGMECDPDYLPTQFDCRLMIQWMMHLHTRFLRLRLDKGLDKWWVWPTPICTFLASMLAKAKDEGYTKKLLDETIKKLCKRIIPNENVVRYGTEYYDDTGDECPEYDDGSNSDTNYTVMENNEPMTYPSNTERYENSDPAETTPQHSFLNLSANNIWSPDQQFDYNTLGAYSSFHPDYYNPDADFPIPPFIPTDTSESYSIQDPILVQSSSSGPSLFNSVAPMNDPSISMSIPSTSMNNPNTSMFIPSTSMNNPSISMNNPSTSMNNPSTSMFNPSTSMFNPSVSLYNPSTSTYNPSTSMYNPSTSMYNPSTSMYNPRASMYNPSTSMNYTNPSIYYQNNSSNPGCTDRASSMSYSQGRLNSFVPSMGNTFLQNNMYRFPPPQFGSLRPPMPSGYQPRPSYAECVAGYGPYYASQRGLATGIHPPNCPCHARNPNALVPKCWPSSAIPNWDMGVQTQNPHTFGPLHGQRWPVIGSTMSHGNVSTAPVMNSSGLNQFPGSSIQNQGMQDNPLPQENVLPSAETLFPGTLDRSGIPKPTP